MSITRSLTSVMIMFMNKTFFLSLLFLLPLFCDARQLNVSSLREGDMLFCVTDVAKTDDFGRSIVESTKGVRSMKISHVAIVCEEDSGICVLEATGDGVVMRTLDKFLAKRGTVLVGRLKGRFDSRRSVLRAKSHIGKAYDYLFSDTDDEFYCSELVQKSYLLKSGELVFSPIPMSFHGEDGAILNYWKEYYGKRGLDVPEGKPGSNPGALSRDRRVKIYPLAK